MGCSSVLQLDEDGYKLQPLPLGRIASYYYLAHETARHFRAQLRATSSLLELLEILCNSHEFATLPVRHNEDQVNAELAKALPVDVGSMTMDSSHTKAHLLLQAHFSRQQLPMADYVTDTKSVLDQTIRVLQVSHFFLLLTSVFPIIGGWTVPALQDFLMVR